MGFYAPFKDPAGRDALVSYFRFTREHRAIYEGARPAAETLLLYPRSAVHAGDVDPVARFRALGKRLVREGIAFDVVPDDILAPENLHDRAVLAITDESALDANAKKTLATFRGARITHLTGEVLTRAGGIVLMVLGMQMSGLIHIGFLDRTYQIGG